MINDVPDITSLPWDTAAYPASAPDYPYQEIGECEECGDPIGERDHYIEEDHLLFCCADCRDQYFQNLEEDDTNGSC